MKVYISADIEGCTFITDWKETEQGEEEYAQGRKIMTNEVVAACEGAIAAGATEIVIKDAHDSALNLIPYAFPEEATLIRGWTCTPESMVAGIDETFDAAVLPRTTTLKLTAVRRRNLTLTHTPPHTTTFPLCL